MKYKKKKKTKMFKNCHEIIIQYIVAINDATNRYNV